MPSFNTSMFGATSSCNNAFLGAWEDDIARLISVNTGTKQLSKSHIDLLNKRYVEAKGYGNTGTTIDSYVSKNGKVSLAVAKEFRLNIEAIKQGEIDKQKAKIALEIDKAKKKGKAVLKWYHYAIIGGGMLTLIALSPTLNMFAKSIPSKRA